MGCICCQKTKALLECGLCKSDVCKYCAQIMPEDSFSYMPNTPEELKHSVYCGPCFVTKIEDTWTAYLATIEKAKNINVFMDDQGKETRLIKRKEKPFKIVDCKDHDEAMMRLAFQAVHSGFNTLVDVSLTSKKVRVNGYQSSVWAGTGIPVMVADRRIK